ncbi:unnamed protein product [Pleuronectes platessa]|uniref:Uncharacterized protein n=1 Tax=Pleuronectes platessa TaxID=8262 RepID=A0A9N7VTW7_PLEPL|nr:unnamed protein product [Pleuronectes platessa]
MRIPDQNTDSLMIGDRRDEQREKVKVSLDCPVDTHKHPRSHNIKCTHQHRVKVEGSVGQRHHAHPPLTRGPPRTKFATSSRKKEELHDASKRARKASTNGDKGSCSEQNRLQQETSAATASQLDRQLAKPGQEAGTAAAAGQVARQPERELATAPAVSQVVHQQPEQQTGTAASAGLISQQDSEGEENAFSGEDCGTSSDRSGMGCTLTAAQFKAKQTYYPWLLMENSGLGCTTCKAVGTLGPEKTGGMKLAKETQKRSE